MKKLLVIILISILVTGCKKDEPQEPILQQGEVSFSADLQEKGLKDVQCYFDSTGNLVEPTYAKVTIGGMDYFPLVYRIDGQLFTQNIKLDPGNYEVSFFGLYSDTDVLLMATPESGSDYENYVSKTVPFYIDVIAFNKLQIDVDVLCFWPDEWFPFGFDWFLVNEIIVWEQCFFGDICVKHPSDYLGSNYELQPNGVQMDMPAIMRLDLYKSLDGQTWTADPIASFTNDLPDYYGAGAPLCIEYSDDIDVPEFFRLELFILVKNGDDFVYEWFHDWYFQDGVMIEDGDDGVVEFVLGECNLTETDLQLPPYQDLPDQVELIISYPGNPGFWDLYINFSIPACAAPATCWDIPIGVNLAGWCADIDGQIPTGTFMFNVYPSLYDQNWPAGMPFTKFDISKVNWLFNNLESFGIDPLNLDISDGLEIQDAIWYLLNGYGTPNDMALAAEGEGGYMPLPGGWAAAILIKHNNPDYQVLFTVVDP